MSLNYIVIQGEVLNSPEKKYTQDGFPVVSFNVSVSKNIESDNYEVGDIKISASKKLADKCQNIIIGTILTIEGRLYTRTVEARDGSKSKIPYIHASNVEIIKEPQIEYHFKKNEVLKEDDIEEDIPF